jgi:hypothetical protein
MRADLIRMAALSMISGRSGKLGGAPAKTSHEEPHTHPTTTNIWQWAQPTAPAIDNPVSPPMLDRTFMGKIDWAAHHRWIVHGGLSARIIGWRSNQPRC